MKQLIQSILLSSFFVLINLALGLSVQAQPVTGPEGDVMIGGIVGHPSAILDLQSSRKGFLLPRLSEDEIAEINQPAPGLIVFNTDRVGLQINIGTTEVPTWDPLVKESTLGSVVWKLKGNAATNAGADFIGTTDNQAFEVHVGNTVSTGTDGRGRVMRFEPDDLSPNLIGGYHGNTVSSGAYGSTIGGGGQALGPHRITSNFGTIGGGTENFVAGDGAVVAGGDRDSATGRGTAVAGGFFNHASGDFSFVGGGVGNKATGSQSVVAGGDNNRATGLNSFAGGGFFDTASGSFSFVGGGEKNRAGGDHSFAGGGEMNRALGDFSTIPGGRGLTLDAKNTFGYLGNNETGSNDMTVVSENVALFANIDFWLANNDGRAAAMLFFSPNGTTGAFPGGASYTAIRAGAQEDNILYTLPTTGPTSGQILQSDASGEMSWTSPNSQSYQSTGVNYTMVDSDVFVGATANGITITLPNASAVGAGAYVVIKDQTGTANGSTPGTTDLTVAAAATETIDGATSRKIATGYGAMRLFSDGTAWFLY